MNSDVNGQMSLLNLLGIEEDEPEKEEVTKKEETKKKEEIKSANSEKSNRKKFEVKKYKCPITVHGGPYSYIIEKDDDEEMSAVKVKNHILKTFPELKGILSPKMEPSGKDKKKAGR